MGLDLEQLRIVCKDMPNDCDELKRWLSHVLVCEYCQGVLIGFTERCNEIDEENKHVS